MAWLIYTIITLGSATLWGIISGWLLYFYLPPGQPPLVPIAFYSVIILASKAVNIMLGLPVGYLSDHTRSSWGRRLPYIIGGALFLPLLFFLLWTPPYQTESLGNLFYLAIVLIAFSAAYEVHQIPYESLLPELAVGEKERVSISTWKTGFLLGGNILSGFAGPLIGKLGYAQSMGIFAAVVAPIIILPGFFLIKRINHAAVPVEKISFRESLKITFRNRPFQIFTLSWGLMWTASTFIIGTIPFIVTEVCGLDKSYAVYFYLSAIIATLIAFPFVTRLSAKYGMKTMYRASLISGAITLPCLFLIGAWIPIPLFAQGIIWIVLQSISLAGAQILPSALAAEITDQDEVLTGQRREGSFYSVWGLLNQVSSGLAAGIIPLFLLLGRSKLDPNGPLGIRLLGLAGGILLFASFWIFRQYNLEENKGTMSNSLSLPLAPGPKGLLFLKSAIGFYRDPIRMFAGLHRDYGNTTRLQGGPYCAHLITQPEHIKYVLQDNAKNYRQGEIFQETAPVVGHGLTTNSGPSWLKQRRMVQFAFQHKHVATLGEGITSATEAYLPRWSENIKLGKPINIDAEILRLNHLILGKLLFSYDFKENDPFLDAFAIVRKVAIDRVRSLVKLPSSKKFDNAVQMLDAFAYKQIAEHHSENPPLDILSMLMQAKDEESGSGMNDTELHDEIMTLFFAAYEDVANAIAWTWSLLAQNPNIEERLRAEIQDVLGGRPPAAAELRDLPYVSMLVNEVLRLYPTTWSLLRDAVNDDQIDGFHIPAGSMILIDCYLTQRLPQYWPDPEKFDPERFSPERSAGRPRFAYFPFGGGPRQCIGNELASMEIKLILIRMVQMYRFTLVSKQPIQMHPLSSLQPRNGVWVKVQAV